MRRALTLLGILAALVVAGLLAAKFLFAEQIGAALFKQAAARAINDTPFADLEDGLHVVLIGTGSPLADPHRAGPSTAIIAGPDVFIVDSGGGTVREMGTLGLSPGRVSAVFLTHLHSDHIDGLGELALQRWATGGRTAPLPVFGPEGVDAVSDGLNMAYAPDKAFRIAHHGEEVVPPDGFGTTAITVSMPEGEEARRIFETRSGLVVTAFPVRHDPVNPAFGYRFDYRGRSVTLSGDTAFDPRVAAAAKDTDILIHEALNTEMVSIIGSELAEAGNTRLAKIMADIPSYHATPVEAARTASDANARLLIISHIVPALPSPALYPYFLKGTSKAYDRPIVIGEDGMMISLPVDSDRIDRKQLN